MKKAKLQFELLTIMRGPLNLNNSQTKQTVNISSDWASKQSAT